MSQLEKQKTTLPCPKCSKDIELSYYDMFSRKEAKCRRCGSLYKFNSSDASNLRSRIRDYEKAQDKFGEEIQKIVKGADITIKK